MKERQGDPQAWGSQRQQETELETERHTERMKGRGALKQTGKGGQKKRKAAVEEDTQDPERPPLSGG